MSKKFRIFIGILLCITMVLTSAVSVMAAAGGTGEPGGLPAAEEASDENSGNGEGGTVPDDSAAENSIDKGDSKDAAGGKTKTDETKTDEADADDKADQNSGEAEKAKDAAGGNDTEKTEDEKTPDPSGASGATSSSDVPDGKTSAEPAGKKSAAKGLSLKAVPGTDVTSEVSMDNGESKSGNFTIGTNGVVIGPDSGGAKIYDSVVTNNAQNTRKGGIDSSRGSAFISRTGGKFEFDNVIINSLQNILVFNIWESATINANNVTLNGSGKEVKSEPFIMVGDYNAKQSGGAALNFSGYSSINKTSGGIRGGDNESRVNITDGTLTISESTINLWEGVRFVVNSGATLKITNTDFIQKDAKNLPAITVEKGGTLVIERGSNLVDTWIDNSGTVTVTDSDLKNCVIGNKKDSSLNISRSGLHDSDRNTSFKDNAYETMIHGSGASITLTYTEIYNNLNRQTSPSREGIPGASIISVKDGSVTMNKVNAHDNAVNTNGGVMHAVDAEVTISDSIFTNNSADNQGWRPGDWYGKGGAVFIEDDHAVVTNTVFKNNRASEGGALNIKSDEKDKIKSVTAVTDCDFSNNNAARAGGALIIWGDGTEAEIRGCNFTGNTAKIYGGAMAALFDNDETGTFIGASGSGANKKPTRFEGNKVTEGADFAGGALFVNCAYVRMENAAVYGNYAEDAGGGLSTCAIGTAEVHVLEGAAIFGNTVGGSSAVDPDIKNYQDVYFKTKDHIDHETGSYLPGRNDFPYYRFELFERMFNGGIHNWKAKTLSVTEDNHKVASLIAQSNPTKKDIGKADVIFTGNEAHKGTTAKPVSGGAIGCNGLLEIGSGGRTEIKVVKRWDDKSNREKLRPDYSTYISELKVWSEYGGSRHYISLPAVHSNSSGQPAASGYDSKTGISVDVFTEGSYAAAGNVAYEDGSVVKADEDEWVIVISGLPEPEKGSYACGESEIIGYRLIDDVADPERGYFEFTNRYHVPGKTVSVTVNKRWKGDDPLDRPESIEMYLLADGKEILKKTVSAADNWSCTFEGLPYTRGEGDSREVIHYTVAEGSPDNYIPSYKTSREDPYDIIETVTNTYHKGYGALMVSKYWDDENDKDGIRPESIEVSLLRQVGGGPVEDTGKKLVLSRKDDWDPVVFADIPLTEDGETIHYTVKEIAVADGYTAEIDHRFEDHHFAEIFNHHKPEGEGGKGEGQPADNTSGKSGKADTGDRNELAAWCAVLVMAAAAAVYTARRKKKQ